MNDLGFPTFFIHLIMTCLTTTRYSLLINGNATELIQPRGLRQGDHLSPLLFTLCKEYSSREMCTIGEHSSFKFHRFKLFSNTTGLYLGVSISIGKFQAGDCELLANKMVSRIKVWSSRHLTFAGIMQLVNTVLMSISIYWAQIFILPKVVIKKINSVCKSFLWYGTYDDSGPGHIAWNNLCGNKDHGGLGFRNPSYGIKQLFAN
ncbi:uncharacterized protein [Spinacia oleracea]|uniref:Reverse transcriptase domain-containing protein n=1 Tax=Spinacia oleracea TaxID=3562 RepID=A0ABM3QYB8_SPIOL|nr:uncharacterized protein LOC130463267 [Spinacia oleracea]